MEYWKVGILEGWFLKGYFLFLILSSTKILPLTQYCIIFPSRRLYKPEAQNPLFHYSSIPPFQWGLSP
jgi:hypothetical protein